MNIGVIGTVFVDIKGYPLYAFVPKGRNAGEVKQFHGGVARNIAEDVANLGEKAIFISLADHSGTSVDVVSHLQKQGVVTDYVKTTPDGMGIWLAIFDETGDVCANISKRPNLLPICDILDECGDELFQKLDSLLVEMDIDADILERAFALAKKYNVPVYGVIANMTIGKERLAYIRQTSCYVCNQQEAGILFDSPTGTMDRTEMLELLKSKQIDVGINCMVVTMGANGAVFSQIGGESGECPAQAVQVIDTTGAGDAFFSGTSVGLTRGYPLAKACQLGIHAASQVIGTKDNVYNSAKDVPHLLGGGFLMD